MKTQQAATITAQLTAQYPQSPTLIKYVAQAHADIAALQRRVAELEAKQAREEGFWMRYHYDTDGMPGW